MGSSSSSERRVHRQQTRAAPPPPPPQQPRGPTAVPQHLMTGHGGGGPAVQRPAQSYQPQQKASAVSEAKTLRNLCSVDEESVKYDAEKALLTFTTNTLVPCKLEVHVAVRVDITHGAALVTPNRPKPPPPQIDVPVDPCGRHELALDLTSTTEIEQKYLPEYKKQIPVVITLRYLFDESVGKNGFSSASPAPETEKVDAGGTQGEPRAEHTFVQLLPTGKVVMQLLEGDGGVFKQEHLFGADAAVAEVATGGESPQAADAAEAMLVDNPESEECVICLTNDKNTAVMPCRHMCMCKECAEELRQRSAKCPVCRGPISQLVAMKINH